MGRSPGLYGGGYGVAETYRICHDERDALCDEKERASFGGGGLPGSEEDCDSGKCCESDECGSYLSLGGGASHGCRTSDRRVQRSALSPGGESQYGNGISDSVDVF